MTAQHTPGPWSVSKLATPDYAPEFAIHAGDDDLARTMNGDSEANAALIASAPELLAALESIARGSIVDVGEHRLGTVNLDKEAMQAIARAAIAKAGGAK